MLPNLGLLPFAAEAEVETEAASQDEAMELEPNDATDDAKDDFLDDAVNNGGGGEGSCRDA